MNKIKVKDSGSLFRDEESGAILNCSDSEYNNYLNQKEFEVFFQQINIQCIFLNAIL